MGKKAPQVQKTHGKQDLSEGRVQPVSQPRFRGLSHELKGDGSFENIVQAKLTIGQGNDKYEQEADRVASMVVQQINTPGSTQSELEITSVQRRQDTARGQDAIASGEGSAELTSAINRARGGGQPLDTSLQQSMGQAMGADFSGVRVHTDARSDQLNKSIQAKAFTTGHDVFFRQGEYQPGSRGGQETIAHELTHVVQQNGGTVQCQVTDIHAIKNFGNEQTIQRAVYKEGSRGSVAIPAKAKFIAKWVSNKTSIKPGGKNHVVNVHNRGLSGFKIGKNMYVGGRVFNNGAMPDSNRLPYSKGQTYQEWDIVPSEPGVNRGTERIVTSSDGKAYFTNDHYRNFTELNF